jgi:hypothetical protein
VIYRKLFCLKVSYCCYCLKALYYFIWLRSLVGVYNNGLGPAPQIFTVWFDLLGQVSPAAGLRRPYFALLSKPNIIAVGA